MSHWLGSLISINFHSHFFHKYRSSFCSQVKTGGDSDDKDNSDDGGYFLPMAAWEPSQSAAGQAAEQDDREESPDSMVG